MERADRAGLGVAVTGHLLLLALLSIGLAKQMPPVKPVQDVMDVQLVDTVGLRSAAPQPATEAPQEMQAPDAGLPAEAAPAPAPSAEPTPTPQPAPPPPKPVPPTPPPPKAVPSPPKPAPTKPEPVAPVAPKKAPPAKPAPAEPAKPKAAAPAKPAPGQISDILKGVRSAAKNEAKSAGSGKAERATANRLGPDFLKGVLNASAGKGEHARASVTGAALNGLAAAIKRQVQPCYDLGALAGTPAMQIVTVLQLRFNKDGSVSGTPQLVEQQGVSGSNQAYARQMVDVSRRAVLRCAPLKLPAELYAGGWENITMGFIPGQMQ